MITFHRIAAAIPTPMRRAQAIAVAMLLAIALLASSCGSESPSVATVAEPTVSATVAATSDAENPDAEANEADDTPTSEAATATTNSATGSSGDDYATTQDIFIQLNSELWDVELDADCVSDEVGRLSAADANAIATSDLATDPNAEPAISPEAEAIAGELLSTCIDVDSYRSWTMLGLPNLDADPDCVAEAIQTRSTVEEIDNFWFNEAWEVCPVS